MKKSFRTQQKILRVFAVGKKYRVGDIVRSVGLTSPTVHKYLNILVEDGILQKHENGPHSTYFLAKDVGLETLAPQTSHYDHNFDYNAVSILEDTFFKYTPDGNILRGVQGFIQRCKQRNSDEYRMFVNYMHIYEAIQSRYNECGLLDATAEFEKYVDTIALDSLFYAGQYKRNEFGRGKLAEQSFYAKQTQHYELLVEVCSRIVAKIECLVKIKKVDALAFTPPSIKRSVQIMDVLDQQLGFIQLPRIELIKDYPHDIVTPQKALRKRADRVLNAKNTIFIYSKNIDTYKTVLLLDDFVGSGATLNETAKKLRKHGVEHVIGCALVGNLDLSYDVINEM